jgi:hypothetical protein
MKNAVSYPGQTSKRRHRVKSAGQREEPEVSEGQEHRLKTGGARMEGTLDQDHLKNKNKKWEEGEIVPAGKPIRLGLNQLQLSLQHSKVWVVRTPLQRVYLLMQGSQDQH